MRTPKMQRAHFQLIADVVQDLTLPPHTLTDEERERVANAFADALRSTNPAFDRQKFLAACGVAD